MFIWFFLGLYVFYVVLSALKLFLSCFFWFQYGFIWFIWLYLVYLILVCLYLALSGFNMVWKGFDLVEWSYIYYLALFGINIVFLYGLKRLLCGFLYGFIWFNVVFFGLMGFNIALSVSIWFYMVFCTVVWYGFTWINRFCVPGVPRRCTTCTRVWNARWKLVFSAMYAL